MFRVDWSVELDQFGLINYLHQRYCSAYCCTGVKKLELIFFGWRDISRRSYEFFRKKLELLDLFAMTLGLIINIILIVSDSSGGRGFIKWVDLIRSRYYHDLVSLRLVIVVRIFRVFNLIRTIRILKHREHFKTSARHLVGQNKKRTIGNGFDLDLCTITGEYSDLSQRWSLSSRYFYLRFRSTCLDRIIAMSFPSKGKDAFFRNDIVVSDWNRERMRTRPTISICSATENDNDRLIWCFLCSYLSPRWSESHTIHLPRATWISSQIIRCLF